MDENELNAIILAMQGLTLALEKLLLVAEEHEDRLNRLTASQQASISALEIMHTRINALENRPSINTNPSIN